MQVKIGPKRGNSAAALQMCHGIWHCELIAVNFNGCRAPDWPWLPPGRGLPI